MKKASIDLETPLDIKRTARFNRVRTHRVTLSRAWDWKRHQAIIIGVNPSVADAETDDQTIRKDIGFIRRFSGGGFVKMNLYDFIATDVRDLLRTDTPESPINLAVFMETIEDGNHYQPIICAWGNHRLRVQRPSRLYDYLKDNATRLDLRCLGPVSKQGQPVHPLMLPYTTELMKLRYNKVTSKWYSIAIKS